jgi:hypothetical protein
MVESFPFWVPGMMPGDRIPHSVLPLAEMGTAIESISCLFLLTKL